MAIYSLNMRRIFRILWRILLALYISEMSILAILKSLNPR